MMYSGKMPKPLYGRRGLPGRLPKLLSTGLFNTGLPLNPPGLLLMTGLTTGLLLMIPGLPPTKPDVAPLTIPPPLTIPGVLLPEIPVGRDMLPGVIARSAGSCVERIGPLGKVSGICAETFGRIPILFVIEVSRGTKPGAVVSICGAVPGNAVLSAGRRSFGE